MKSPEDVSSVLSPSLVLHYGMLPYVKLHDPLWAFSLLPSSFITYSLGLNQEKGE